MTGIKWIWIATLAVCLAMLAGGLALAAPALAAHQFTLDSSPDSFGPIVTDAAGNGYVAWEHADGVVDTPTFCKLPPGATRCDHPVALGGIPDVQGDQANALAPFPILGPGQVVWVVTDRYIGGDALIWTSDDGGATFGPAHEIPDGQVCVPPQETCGQSQPFTGLDNLDDTVPVTDATTPTPYDRQLYLNGSVPFASYLQSSYNPGLGFDWQATDTQYSFGAGVFEFTFGDTRAADSTLGVSNAGQTVEAYYELANPATLGYYYFVPTAHCPAAFVCGPSSWQGPVTLGTGDEPRLADGPGGLYLLSSVASDSAGDISTVEVRRWDDTTSTFGAPVRLLVNPASTAGSYLFVGGGLGENPDTGELAAAWPDFATGDMQVWLSSNGTHYAAPIDVATVAGGYGDDDNTRVALADDGTGFVTFLDSHGIQVADLLPLGGQYKMLKASRHGRGFIASVTVTCPAPSGKCRDAVSLTKARGRHTLLAKRSFAVPGGTSTVVELALRSAADPLLAHGPVAVSLSLRLRGPSGPSDELVTRATLRR